MRIANTKGTAVMSALARLVTASPSKEPQTTRPELNRDRQLCEQQVGALREWL